MIESTKLRLFGLLFILGVVVAFAAGMHWNGGIGPGMFTHSCELESAASGSMDGCPMMGMDHESMAASVKNASEPTSAAGCSMAGMGCGEIDGQSLVNSDNYPLEKCPITNMKLGAMGDTIIKKYEGIEVRFCCGGCPEKFEQDLPSNLKKLTVTIAKAQEARSGNLAANQVNRPNPPAVPQNLSLCNNHDQAHFH